MHDAARRHAPERDRPLASSVRTSQNAVPHAVHRNSSLVSLVNLLSMARRWLAGVIVPPWQAGQRRPLVSGSMAAKSTIVSEPCEGVMREILPRQPPGRLVDVGPPCRSRDARATRVNQDSN